MHMYIDDTLCAPSLQAYFQKQLAIGRVELDRYRREEKRLDASEDPDGEYLVVPVHMCVSMCVGVSTYMIVQNDAYIRTAAHTSLRRRTKNRSNGERWLPN
jgi:hypothetical protein